MLTSHTWQCSGYDHFMGKKEAECGEVNESINSDHIEMKTNGSFILYFYFNLLCGIKLKEQCFLFLAKKVDFSIVRSSCAKEFNAMKNVLTFHML